MKKMISFRQVKENCAWEIIQNRGTLYDCGYLSDERVKCTARNCPVWKKLEPSWTIAEPCRKCIYSSPDDQICDHTGFDKRTVKKCKYRKVL